MLIGIDGVERQQDDGTGSWYAPHASDLSARLHTRAALFFGISRTRAGRAARVFTGVPAGPGLWSNTYLLT